MKWGRDAQLKWVESEGGYASLVVRDAKTGSMTGSYRVFAQNAHSPEPQIVVVRACRYGWKNGYDYLAVFPLHGAGYAAILNRLLGEPKDGHPTREPLHGMVRSSKDMATIFYAAFKLVRGQVAKEASYA
jgi:hypothetical protein